MQSEQNSLSISSVDGRYRSKTESLAPIASEFGLMKYRIQVECEWLLTLCATSGIPECPSIDKAKQQFIRSIGEHFDIAAATAVKEFEQTTNHDVKAVEYYIKTRLQEDVELDNIKEWVHFACTSEDINNAAYGLMVKASRDTVLLPGLDQIITELDQLAQTHAQLPMLSRTHGQDASPTTLGKEIKNVAARLQRQRTQLAEIEILGKINGAVGNYNAHAYTYPEVDWPELSASFLERIGLTQNPWTTQIEPHDYLAELFHCLMRANQILLDFDRDMWSYISIDYFTQRKVEGETGSSTMPHKVNPIDFENSEGNLGIANALLEHMASKLQVSRWQRDLSDSTVLRNIGSAFAHCIIAYQATLKGLSRLEVNAETITADLNASWAILAEAVQTVMRKHGMDEPYERLKTATRGQQVTESSYQQLLIDLDLPKAAYAELKTLTPAGYVGLAPTLATKTL